MRKITSAILLLAMLFTLCSCASQAESIRFYYLREEFVPGTSDGVIAQESREVTADRGLNYVLRLYLEGPISELYASPFPEGLFLISTQQEGDTLNVILSAEFSSLEGMDLTLAAGCLATTCFELTDAQQVTIFCDAENENPITLTRDSFLLLDEVTPAETTE